MVKSGYCTIIWDRGASEISQHQPHQSLHPKTVLCIWWDWKGVPCYKLLLESWMINFNKYCSQLDQLKAVLDEKCPESVNRKHIILHQDNARLHACFLMTRQKLLNLAGKFWFICCIHQPLHLQISIYFGLYKILNGKNFSSLKDWRKHLKQFFAQKKKFWNDGIMNLPEKMAEARGTNQWIWCQ